MEIKLRDSGAIVSEHEFRAMHPQTGFPPVLTLEIINEFGGDPVLEAPAPEVGEYQTAVRDGAKLDTLGNLVFAWRVIDWEQEQIDAYNVEKATRLVKHYDGVVQQHLDAVARSFGYGDPNRPEVSPILHAISYAEEPAVERFMNEGRALRAWRSLVWVTAAGILNAVKAGTRAIPTEAELLAELPPPTQDPL